VPPVVTHCHPSEVELLDLAAGRQVEHAAESERHVAGCRLCDKRLRDLRELVKAIREDEAFNDALTSKKQPEASRAGGKTLPFVKARPPLEEIWRIAQQAEPAAEAILAAAKVSIEEAEKVSRSLDGNPCRGFAFLYACQRADVLVASDPNRALELARFLFEEAETLVEANVDIRSETPAPRQSVQAEATLLESQALLQLLRADEARAVVARARELFDSSGDIGFGQALCDYYEGSAAGFAKDYVSAERLLKRALKVFAEFGQEHLVARAEAGLGTLLLYRGDSRRAAQHLAHALEGLDPETESSRFVACLSNYGLTLARLGQFDRARASYARALNVARHHGFSSRILMIRTGMAETDFRRGRYARALWAFRELAREYRTAGHANSSLFADLYAAECLGRLGRDASMADSVSAIREYARKTPFDSSPAMDELFTCLDQGALDADLISHVREYLEDIEAGKDRPYQRLRLVG